VVEAERRKSRRMELGYQAVVVAVDQLQGLVYHILIIRLLGLHGGSFLPKQVKDVTGRRL
jgi:hypothetical protein